MKQPSSSPRFTALYRKHQASLVCTLQGRYRSTCPGRVEDAVEDAFTAVLASPSLGARLNTADERESWRLLYQIAWRGLRGQRRRRAFHDERPLGDEELELASPAWREHSPESAAITADLSRRVLTLIPGAAMAHGKGHADRVALALRARLEDGLDDGEAARAFGVPREYVNRAKRHLQLQVA